MMLDDANRVLRCGVAPPGGAAAVSMTPMFCLSVSSPASHVNAIQRKKWRRNYSSNADVFIFDQKVFKKVDETVEKKVV